MLLFSRHGKVRMKKWFSPFTPREKLKLTSDAVTTILARKTDNCNILEWKEHKFVYKRYASLVFCAGVDPEDNELIVLEMIHRYVEVLDSYFGSVCELDIIFNFEQAYNILDELFMGGEFVESSKKVVTGTLRLADEAEQSESYSNPFPTNRTEIF